MASNSFGTHFRMTTWGESHGKAIGCVIDGCPAGVMLSLEDIQRKVDLRAPGMNAFVSPRKERDQVVILSGVFEGKTTGAPIMLLVANEDADSSAYLAIKDVLRPGHAQFAYLAKYGHYDFRGGGRASARETVARVAAGAVAEKLLEQLGVSIVSRLLSVGGVSSSVLLESRSQKAEPPLFCLSEEDSIRMAEKIEQVQKLSDSVGGVVETCAFGVPPGLGDPVYEKIEAKLAFAMMSLPASKAFEIGEGVKVGAFLGSEHNDSFTMQEGKIMPASNHAGGTLGGITTGEKINIRTHFKPTSSIKKEQHTVDMQGTPSVLSYPEHSRHDPCVAVRAVPVCQAMCALVLADCLLMQRLARV